MMSAKTINEKIARLVEMYGKEIAELKAELAETQRELSVRQKDLAAAYDKNQEIEKENGIMDKRKRLEKLHDECVKNKNFNTALEILVRLFELDEAAQPQGGSDAV